MVVVVNFCFNGEDRQFIAIAEHGAIGNNSQQKHRLHFNKISLICITYIYIYYYIIELHVSL